MAHSQREECAELNKNVLRWRLNVAAKQVTGNQLKNDNVYSILVAKRSIKLRRSKRSILHENAKIRSGDPYHVKIQNY